MKTIQKVNVGAVLMYGAFVYMFVRIALFIVGIDL